MEKIVAMLDIKRESEAFFWKSASVHCCDAAGSLIRDE